MIIKWEIYVNGKWDRVCYTEKQMLEDLNNLRNQYGYDAVEYEKVQI